MPVPIARGQLTVCRPCSADAVGKKFAKKNSQKKFRMQIVSFLVAFLQSVNQTLKGLSPEIVEAFFLRGDLRRSIISEALLI